QAWDIAAKVDTDTIASLTATDNNCGIDDDKVKPQQVAHGKDINPPEVEGKLTDNQSEAIENPNVSTARGPAHSE
ncbi:MAG TPA: hypothetical protein VLN09_06425, partial [Psychrobacter sp.]|uniref:hypothetical protein n=1 Tax=Psychrobacter sp. TaxID=56811 RepID=UPI002C508E59